MKQQPSSSSSGRPYSSRQGGSRRRSGGQSRSNRSPSDRPSNGGGGHAAGNGAATAKPGLWQKIVALFTGGTKRSPSPSSPAPGGARPASPSRGGGGGGGGRPSFANNDGRGNSADAEPAPARADSGGGADGDAGASRGGPGRKPEILEVTTPRLYVGNLSFDATESDLTELFNGVGRALNVEIISHRHNQRSKGFAFVQMQSVDEAKRAVEQLHDQEFLGRKLFVSGAKNPDQHDGRDEPRFAS